MKKAESFCTACEWQGDGTGLAECPICGAPITALDVDEHTSKGNEEYPEEMLQKEELADNLDAKDI